MKQFLTFITLIIFATDLSAQDTVNVHITKPIDDFSLYMPILSDYILKAKASNTDTLHSIDTAFFKVDGVVLPTVVYGEYYIANYKPTVYGVHNIEFTGVSTSGQVDTDNQYVEFTQSILNVTARALDSTRVKFGGEGRTVHATAKLPNHVGAFDSLHAVMEVVCPTGDCDPWDRVAWINIKAPDGTWIELIHYITSYGRTCTHEIDLTEYLFLLDGEVEFEIFVDTWAGSWEFILDLEYYAGIPENKYGNITPIYDGAYPFGDYSNLMPFETNNIVFDEDVNAAQFNMLLSGHGWDPAINTGNAAEFYHAVHTLYLDGASISQDPWRDCNPNPDDCSPQGGSWQFDRAGWCPGAITHPFVYDLDSYLTGGEVELYYEYDQGYLDLCHPNHPDCVSGTTCDDCDAGYNPHYQIGANLFTYTNDEPFEKKIIPIENPVSISQNLNQDGFDFYITPNPTSDHIIINQTGLEKAKISIHDTQGKVIKTFFATNGFIEMSVSDFAKGIYFVQVQNGKKSRVKKLIVE